MITLGMTVKLVSSAAGVWAIGYGAGCAVAWLRRLTGAA
jgi:hypothetical protein